VPITTLACGANAGAQGGKVRVSLDVFDEEVGHGAVVPYVVASAWVPGEHVFASQVTREAWGAETSAGLVERGL